MQSNGEMEGEKWHTYRVWKPLQVLKGGAKVREEQEPLTPPTLKGLNALK